MALRKDVEHAHIESNIHHRGHLDHTLCHQKKNRTDHPREVVVGYYNRFDNHLILGNAVQ